MAGEGVGEGVGATGGWRPVDLLGTAGETARGPVEPGDRRFDFGATPASTPVAGEGCICGIGAVRHCDSSRLSMSQARREGWSRQNWGQSRNRSGGRMRQTPWKRGRRGAAGRRSAEASCNLRKKGQRGNAVQGTRASSGLPVPKISSRIERVSPRPIWLVRCSRTWPRVRPAAAIWMPTSRASSTPCQSSAGAGGCGG